MTDDDQDVYSAYEVLLETCDCAACERARRAERRKAVVPVYMDRLKRGLAQSARRR